MPTNNFSMEDIDEILAFRPLLCTDSEVNLQVAKSSADSPFPFDFIATLEEKNFTRFFDYSEYIEEYQKKGKAVIPDDADLDELQKNITAQIRMERFNEGHLKSIQADGYFDAFFSRLEAVKNGK